MGSLALRADREDAVQGRSGRHWRQAACFSLLAVLVSACSAGVEVPDAIGAEEGYARGLMVGAGFTVAIESEVQSGVPPGQILRQTPAPGEVADAETTVTLVVSESPAIEISGTFTLNEGKGGTPSDCRGEGGYDDIRAGTEVVVRDGDGSILATAALEQGSRAIQSSVCVFAFTVGGLPEADFYTVAVGRRGDLTYSFDDLEQAGWFISLELG